MGEDISDKELRRRLSEFKVVVPPVTNSTRKLLLKKLANLENSETNKNAVSSIMPPPKSKVSVDSTNESIMISSSLDGGKRSQHTKFEVDSPRKSVRRRRANQTRDPFDISDSEVDAGTLGYSIQSTNPYISSSSPKSNETSLMNVSNWKNAVDADDKNSYISPETKIAVNKKYGMQTEKINPKLNDFKVNLIPTEPDKRKIRSGSVTKTLSHAELAIQRWKEKKLNESLNQNDVSSTSFSSNSKVPSYSSRKNVQSTLKSYQKNFNTKNTQYAILLFIVFFAVIFGLYFISIQPSTIELPPGILNSMCAKKNLQESNCITEQEKVQRLYNSLVSQVQDKYVKNQCDQSNVEPSVDAKALFEYISTHENIPSREIDELVELLKSIAKTYSDSPIGFDTSFKINVQPNLPITCAIKNIFSNVFYLVIWLGIVALSVIVLYFLIFYITSKSEKYKQEVNKLVEDTIELLKEQAKNRPNESYLPIIHIRDHLIPSKERQAKAKIWAEVVQYFTESESSIRSEIQEIDGEDFEVWKWVQPMSPGILSE